MTGSASGATAGSGAAPGAGSWKQVAVIAHSGKTLDGGLDELRRMLADVGVDDPWWAEVDKSRKAPKRVRAALADGVSTVLVWGGDGMVQQCAGALVGTDVPMGIIPAGTANLLATNLGIAHSLQDAVKVALHGSVVHLDVGTINGECFTVMGGAGFDGTMIADVDGGAKDRLGRIAYVRESMKAMAAPVVDTVVEVDGHPWFEGPSSCVLIGNVGTVIGGLRVFKDASPTDGLLDVGVVSAQGRLQWLRVLGRVVGPGDAEHSPLIRSIVGKKIDVRFDKKVRYELDGGAREKTRKLKVRIRPGALAVRVPSG